MYLTKRDIAQRLDESQRLYWVANRVLWADDQRLRESEIILRTDREGMIVGIELYPKVVYDGKSETIEWISKQMNIFKERGYKNTEARFGIDSRSHVACFTYRHYERYSQGLDPDV